MKTSMETKLVQFNVDYCSCGGHIPAYGEAGELILIVGIPLSWWSFVDDRWWRFYEILFLCRRSLLNVASHMNMSDNIYLSNSAENRGSTTDWLNFLGNWRPKVFTKFTHSEFTVFPLRPWTFLHFTLLSSFRTEKPIYLWACWIPNYSLLWRRICRFKVRLGERHKLSRQLTLINLLN